MSDGQSVKRQTSCKATFNDNGASSRCHNSSVENIQAHFLFKATDEALYIMWASLHVDLLQKKSIVRCCHKGKEIVVKMKKKIYSWFVRLKSSYAPERPQYPTVWNGPLPGGLACLLCKIHLLTYYFTMCVAFHIKSLILHFLYNICMPMFSWPGLNKIYPRNPCTNPPDAHIILGRS